MGPLQLVVLAVVQGVTEFLPISSSAHLILIPRLTGWPDQGLAFDVAAHLGTLAAVTLYFRADLVGIARGFARSITGREGGAEGRLAWGVLLGTIPVGLAGLAAHDVISGSLRSPLVIALATVVFALALAWADARGRRRRPLTVLGLRDVAVIGCAQALALIPGTSRSGITMTAGLALGFTREAAARFSFLLAVPVILLASALEVAALIAQGGTQAWGALTLVTALSGLSAFACIHVFLSVIERTGMLPFVVYRLVLGAVLLAWFV